MDSQLHVPAALALWKKCLALFR